MTPKPNENIDVLNQFVEQLREDGGDEASETADSLESAVKNLSEEITNLSQAAKKREKREETEQPKSEQEDKPAQMSQEEVIKEATKEAVKEIRKEENITALAMEMGIDPIVATTMISAKPEDFEGDDKSYLESLNLGKQAPTFESTEFAIPKTKEERDALFTKDQIEAEDFLTKEEATFEKLEQTEEGRKIADDLRIEHFDARDRMANAPPNEKSV